MKSTLRANLVSILVKLLVVSLAAIVLTLFIDRTASITASETTPVAPPVAISLPEGAVLLPETDYVVDKWMSDDRFTTFFVLSEAARITCPIAGLTNPRHPDAFIHEDVPLTIQSTTETKRFTAYFHGIPQECFYLGPWELGYATTA